MKNCGFCNPSNIVSEIQDYGEVMVFEPLNPVVAGHLLVVPRQHVTDFTTDNTHILCQVMSVASQVAKANGGDFNLITSKGTYATQSIMHLHIHLIPRTENDGLHLPWTNQEH